MVIAVSTNLFSIRVVTRETMMAAVTRDVAVVVIAVVAMAATTAMIVIMATEVVTAVVVVVIIAVVASRRANPAKWVTTIVTAGVPVVTTKKLERLLMILEIRWTEQLSAIWKRPREERMISRRCVLTLTRLLQITLSAKLMPYVSC